MSELTITNNLSLEASERPTASSRGPSGPVTVIEPRSAWRAIDTRELWRYRDLFRFLVWRDIRVAYAQSALGLGWAVAQPLATMIVLTLVFGYFGRVSSDGYPYPVFSMSALVPWTFFAAAVVGGVGSLVNDANMLRKIYFPRLLLPLAAVTAKLMNFGIAFVILLPLMMFYGITPTWRFAVLPLFIALMIVAAAGIAVWLTALAVQFRDIRHGIAFLIQLMMYASPIIYSSTIIPEKFRPIYDLNPMVAVIEGFRWCVFGTTAFPTQSLLIGSLVAGTIFGTGLFYFRKRERLFADVA